MSVTLAAPGYTSERLRGSVGRILSSNALCSMATRGAESAVHINTAFFCFSDDLALYFLSEPASVHCRNVSRSPGTAIAVFDSHHRWGAAHEGLQLFGECRPATGAAEREARDLYSIRFPSYPELQARLSHLRFYGFTPATIKILDESEFGEEVLVTADVVG